LRLYKDFQAYFSEHKGKEVDEWLAAHKNVSLHFTPTYSSWANLTEVFFGKHTRQVLKAENFESVADMCRAIMAYV
jgi:hypothetical protein